MYTYFIILGNQNTSRSVNWFFISSNINETIANKISVILLWDEASIIGCWELIFSTHCYDWFLISSNINEPSAKKICVILLWDGASIIGCWEFIFSTHCYVEWDYLNCSSKFVQILKQFLYFRISRFLSFLDMRMHRLSSGRMELSCGCTELST